MRNLILFRQYDKFHKETSVQKKIINENNFTYKIILPIINKYARSENVQHVLDIGSGAGTLAFYLANKGKKVLGIDISQIAVDKSNLTAKKLGIKQLKFKKLNFPYQQPLGIFDLILCSEVIEHLQDDFLALKIMYKLLKPGGIIILSTPSKNAPLFRLGLAHDFDKRVGHLRRYNIDDLTKLCKKAGFNILETKKSEGIFRNFLFLNPIAGKFVRFIKFFLVDIVTEIDNISLHFFGESQLFVILTK